MRIATATRPGLAPAGEFLLVDAKRNQKRLLNVHQCVRLQPPSTRCVHLLAALPRKAAPSVHVRRDWGARSTLEDRADAPVPAPATSRSKLPNTEYRIPHAECRMPRPFAVWRGASPLPPRFAFSECSVVLVTTRVHGWSSISGQCRQQVNTPCYRPLQSDALMNVWF